jgi:hypothetical protein
MIVNVRDNPRGYSKLGVIVTSINNLLKLGVKFAHFDFLGAFDVPPDRTHLLPWFTLILVNVEVNPFLP